MTKKTESFRECRIEVNPGSVLSFFNERENIGYEFRRDMGAVNAISMSGGIHREEFVKFLDEMKKLLEV